MYGNGIKKSPHDTPIRVNEQGDIIDNLFIKSRKKSIKVAKVQWSEIIFSFEDHCYNGLVNKIPMFHLDRSGVRKIKWTLKTVPFTSNFFTPGNNTKIVYVGYDLKEAKETAQKLLEEYVNFFLQSPITK